MSSYKVFEIIIFHKIFKSITAEEFIEAMEWAIEAGLTNLDVSRAYLEIARRTIR